jgi:short subunit dehydrogenase-like uncharacterized protein
MAEPWMIYGATGYTGRLVVEEAVRRGHAPVLAGRDGARLAQLAGPLGLEHRAVSLNDPPRLARALAGIRVVLNAAGPFAATAAPLAAACLAAPAHYLDLAGEIEVFAALRRLDGEARRRGVLLLPGAGFVVVPSDCLAAHVARRLPTAHWLRLAISRSPFLSRGSARTVVELIGGGAQVRKEGRMTRLPWSRLARRIDFGTGDGPRPSLVLSWADVYTAYFTTGIANIEVCVEVSPWEEMAFQAGRFGSRLLGTAAWQRLLRAQVEMLPAGPSPAERARHRRVVLAVVGDALGRRAAARLETPDSYTLTATAAVAAVERTLGGLAPGGFQTPAAIYGADFVLGLPGVVREDLAL